MDEIMRRIEKYGNGKYRWVCLLCPNRYFETTCDILAHLKLQHGLTEVKIDIVEWKGYAT